MSVFLGSNNVAHKLAMTLINNGWSCFFVGGAVRDHVMGKDPHDIDLTTNAPYKMIVSIMNHNGYDVDVVGAAFNVAIVNGVEIASYRSECYQNGTLEIMPCNSIEDDLARRDFTCNAMAMCPITGDIIDPFNGINDVNAKIVRFVGDPTARIIEDPLRAYRAARMAAIMGEGAFIHKDSMIAIMDNVPNILDADIPKERISQEIIKAMGTEVPSLFWTYLDEMGLLFHIFPEMSACAGHYHGKHHAEDIFTHLMLCGDALPADKPMLRLAGYLHDIGKPIAMKSSNGENFHGHHTIGASIVRSYLRDLKFPNMWVDQISSMVRYHMRNLMAGISEKAVRRTLHHLDSNFISSDDFLALRIADHNANMAKPKLTQEEINGLYGMFEKARSNNNHQAFDLKMLCINGKDVMRVLDIGPGPNVGRTLQFLFDVVVSCPDLNTKDTMEALAVSFYTKMVTWESAKTAV